jgi:glycosyltransferase involved in cell wall biosynthesis
MFAASLAEGFKALDGVEPFLSLSADAEILRPPQGRSCELPMRTYTGIAGLAWQLLRAPITVVQLTRHLHRLEPQAAVCAMPGPLDLLMVMALRRVGIPIAIIVHDATAHPGDGYPLLYTLQRALLRRAHLVITLSRHVAAKLSVSGSPGIRGNLMVAAHPPFAFGQAKPARSHAGPRRILCFGRLRSYKGLDLLAEALRLVGPRSDMEVRIVGEGPESAALAVLRATPGVKVENRWVPEHEIGAILNWADIVVMPYTEASQSGIAPSAVALGRQVVATRVGGLPEQLETEPLAALCEPVAASLAAALVRALEEPNLTAFPANDPRDAWRRFAAKILEELVALNRDDDSMGRQGLPCRDPYRRVHAAS